VGAQSDRETVSLLILPQAGGTPKISFLRSVSSTIVGQVAQMRARAKLAGAKKDGEGQELPSPHYSANELAN
jgi:hypothetical protein